MSCLHACIWFLSLELQAAGRHYVSYESILPKHVLDVGLLCSSMVPGLLSSQLGGLSLGPNSQSNMCYIRLAMSSLHAAACTRLLGGALTQFSCFCLSPIWYMCMFHMGYMGCVSALVTGCKYVHFGRAWSSPSAPISLLFCNSILLCGLINLDAAEAYVLPMPACDW